MREPGDRRAVTALATAVVSMALVVCTAHAADQGITGKKLLIKGDKVLVLSKDPTISAAGSDPVGGSDSTISLDNGGGPVDWNLPATLWSTNGAGTLFKYKNSQAPSGRRRSRSRRSRLASSRPSRKYRPSWCQVAPRPSPSC